MHYSTHLARTIAIHKVLVNCSVRSKQDIAAGHNEWECFLIGQRTRSLGLHKGCIKHSNLWYSLSMVLYRNIHMHGTCLSMCTCVCASPGPGMPQVLTASELRISVRLGLFVCIPGPGMPHRDGLFSMWKYTHVQGEHVSFQDATIWSG